MNKIVDKILPGAIYKRSLMENEKQYPFYSFCQPNSDSGWSDQMTISLGELSKDHFIDRYNRKVALDGIRDKLVGENCCYLDVGCSSGYMLADVLKRFPEVHAVGADYFSVGLLQCHKCFPDIPLFQIDLANCQFGDNLFDAVTCLNVLEHIPNDQTALKHLFRIIKPGGKMVVTVPMGRGLYDIYDEVHYHIRRYEKKELIYKINSAGFDILKNNYFGVFVYPGFSLIKKVNRLRFCKISEDEKKRIVFKEIKNSSRSVFMERLCSIEYFLGKIIKYPFGIRGYVVANKPIR